MNFFLQGLIKLVVSQLQLEKNTYEIYFNDKKFLFLLMILKKQWQFVSTIKALLHNMYCIHVRVIFN